METEVLGSEVICLRSHDGYVPVRYNLRTVKRPRKEVVKTTGVGDTRRVGYPLHEQRSLEQEKERAGSPRRGQGCVRRETAPDSQVKAPAEALGA